MGQSNSKNAGGRHTSHSKRRLSIQPNYATPSLRPSSTGSRSDFKEYPVPANVDSSHSGKSPVFLGLPDPVRPRPSDSEDSDITAASLIKDVFVEFNKIISSDALERAEQNIPLQSWRDELCRFHLWARNVGYQDELTPLDDRLKRAPHLQTQVLGLLQDVLELLEELHDNEDGTSESSEFEEWEGYREETESINQLSQAEHIFKTLKESINYLNKMSAVMPQGLSLESTPATLSNDLNDLRINSSGLAERSGKLKAFESRSSTYQDAANEPSSSEPFAGTGLPSKTPSPSSQRPGESILIKSPKHLNPIPGITNSLLPDPGPYNGTGALKAIDLDDMITRLLDIGYSDKVTKHVCLKNAEIMAICSAARDLLLSQPSLLELSHPVKIVGDIHGQYTDLLRIFETCGFPPTSNYLFLGDYVDRGKQSLETILLLLCYKLKYPENFFLLRGNHECANVTRIYGFYDECKRRSNIKVWRSFIDTFNCLPIAATISNKIFCVHGGLSPGLQDMDDIRGITRPTDIPDYGLLNDLLWSDPAPMDQDCEWEPNERGVSYIFGKKVVANFLQRHDFDLICRSHMVVEDGYELDQDRMLVTIFSAPNYCGEFDNHGAIMSVSAELLCSFEIFEPLDTAAQKSHRKEKREARHALLGLPRAPPSASTF